MLEMEGNLEAMYPKPSFSQQNKTLTKNIENVETKGGNTSLRCKDPYYFVGIESQPFWRRKIKKGLF